MARKLNSMRVLEKASVAYREFTFPDSIHSAEGVADYLDLPRAQVFKTLVVLRDRQKPLLVMVAGDREVNLKVLAKSIGEKKLTMASYADAERLTRLKVGGISALALINRGFVIYLDRSATDWEKIVMSAGQRGINLLLPVKDLIRVTGARLVDVV